MAKVKFDPKDFLLRKGEVLVMGVAGFFLILLLIWGASTWITAKDPEKESKQLNEKARSVQNSIETGTPTDGDKTSLQPPEWVIKPYSFNTADVSAFKQTGPLFDPTAQPNTKRENPAVLPITDYQVDLVRAAMAGYDIIVDNNGDALIAVLTKANKSNLDDEKIKKAADGLLIAADRNAKARIRLRDQRQAQRQSQNQGMPGPGGIGPNGGSNGPGQLPGPNGGSNGPGQLPGPGGGGPGGGKFGSGFGPPGGRFGGSGFGPPGGMMGGEYDQSAQRSENTIKYIPLKEIDTAVKGGNLPALTVIPLRMVTINAVVPYKMQLNEIKRALRLSNPPATAKKEDIERADAEAKQWGPWYDGFEVQRRVTRMRPNGEPEIIEDWPVMKDLKDTSGNYPFEELYIDKIDTKKIADHLDEGYLPYFLKQDMMLSMPLPQLAKDLNVQYPEIKLKAILDNIEKLRKANQKEIPQSELLKQLTKNRARNSLYGGRTADGLAGLGYSNAEQFGPTLGKLGGGMPATTMPALPGPVGMGGQGRFQFPDGYGPTSATPIVEEVDNFMLRFVDCDVRPGRTYEYRIRLRMLNPNYGQDKLVAVPEYAKENFKILYSAWFTLLTPITVPTESHLYAQDVKTYRDRNNENHPNIGRDATAESKALNKMLQVRENQAVAQVTTWMEQVLAGEGSKREPVGAWVVADMPVGRGEFIGRKQYIKLPLWSSESQEYALREVPDKVVKGKYQPKGWMVDFSTPDILVDFEGGKTRTQSDIRFDSEGKAAPYHFAIEEDSATEMLIIGQDGKLVVHSSVMDDADPLRKSITSEWSRWVKEVESRKGAGGKNANEPNQFDPKK